MTKVLVLYYSSYGHIETMAYAAAEGAREAGAEAVVKRVPELVSEEIARKSGYKLDQPAPTATQHGGQEATILTFHPVLFHLGFVVVGLPYSFQGQMGVSEVMGNTPYGASTIAGGDGSRQPSRVELDGVRFQGKHVAQIAAKLSS